MIADLISSPAPERPVPAGGEFGALASTGRQVTGDRFLRSRSLGLAGFVLALSACGAAAQTAAPPLGAERFAIDARSHVIYQSNLSGGGDAIAAVRKLEPSDVSYDFGATLKFQLLSGKKVLFLTAAADARRYERNKILNGENYNLTTGALGRVGACDGSVIASYSLRQALVQDLAVPVAKNEVAQPAAVVQASCGRGGLIGSIQGSVQRLENSTKTAGFINSENRNGTVTVGYSNKSLGDLSLVGQYIDVAYATVPIISPLAGRPSSPNYKEYGFGVQYARKIGSRLSGTATVSSMQLKSASGGGQGLNANASLNYRVTPRIQLQLNYTLGNRATVLANTNYVRSEAITFSPSYQLSRRIALHATIQKSHDKYEGGIASPLQLRDSELTSGSLGGSIRIGRKIMLTLDGRHDERKADIRLYDFKSDNVTLGLTTQF